MHDNNESKAGFCIYIHTVCEGSIPVERNENGFPVVYASLLEAQREIADDTMERLRQFLAGERDFDDAMTVEEYIVAVDVLADGSVKDESGHPSTFLFLTKRNVLGTKKIWTASMVGESQDRRHFSRLQIAFLIGMLLSPLLEKDRKYTKAKKPGCLTGVKR